MWGDPGNSTLMQSLPVLHNKSAREILGLPYFSSASNAITKLGWISLDRRRSRHRVNFVYKCINGLTDYDFNPIFNKSVHSYNTRNKENIRKPLSRRRWGRWTVLSHASDDWNKVEPSKRAIKEFHIFKKELYLFL